MSLALTVTPGFEGGFKGGATATRFCRSFDEIRAFLRPQLHRNQWLSRQQQLDIHRERFPQLMRLMAAA